MLTLKQLELFHILDCLMKNSCKMEMTAKELGISRRTLQEKVKILKYQGFKIPTIESQSVKRAMEADGYCYCLASNEERLKHADSMLNRDYL